MPADTRRRTTQKSSAKHTNSIVEQLRQQTPTSHSKKRRNDDLLTSLSQRSEQSTRGDNGSVEMEIDMDINDDTVTVFQTDTISHTDQDDHSEATANVENLNKDLFTTRVDLRVKVPPHTNPEEKTVQVLQELLLKLQSYDPKVRIAPWYSRCNSPPLHKPSDFTPRPSELEKYFPRIFFKEEGFTWYSGVRLIHAIPVPDLRQDMIRWLKREGHGLFERMLQAADTTEIGWLVYSTWQMEAPVLAQAIEETINMSVGLRWKQVSTGSREKLPPDQQVKALHVEVALENRVAAQRALLAVYGRKTRGQYPNGIRLRFSLPIHAAHNLNAKAKLERLRARQQVWTNTYEKGFSWEITQLDHPISKHAPSLRQALLSLMSATNPKFPLFHSVDRSTYRESGICFQFLPQFAEEARMTISNLVPLMKHKYGPSALSVFSPSAVERMEGCQWDPNSGTVIGKYDDEITYLDEEDPMKEYVSSKQSKSMPNSINTGTTEVSSANRTPITDPTSLSLLPIMDDDSVSTLGNNTLHRWTPSTSIQLPPPLTQRPSYPLTPPDDASVGSISTLTTRLTTMESQYNQISGAVQDIKSMLAGLAQSNYSSHQAKSPANDDTAGRDHSAAGDDL